MHPTRLASVVLSSAIIALHLPAPVLAGTTGHHGAGRQRANPNTRKMTRLHDGHVHTWGTVSRPTGGVASRCPIVGTVRGTQSSSRIYYYEQQRSLWAKTVPANTSEQEHGRHAKAGKRSPSPERIAFSKAEQWKLAITDVVGAQDNPEMRRISPVANEESPIGIPFRITGTREMLNRPAGGRKARTLKHRYNTIYAHAEPIPGDNSLLAEGGPAPFNTSFAIRENAVDPTNTGRLMRSSAAGYYEPFAAIGNFGITLPQNPGPDGIGRVSVLNFAAFPHGAQVVVTNVTDRTQRAEFVAGKTGPDGHANRGVLMAKAGQALRVVATMPNGRVVTFYTQVPSKNVPAEVLIESHSRGKQGGKHGKHERRHRTRRSVEYLRAQQIQPLGMRISPALPSKTAGGTEPVVVVHLPDILEQGTATITNKATGQKQTVDVTTTGEVRLPGTVNDRLEVTSANGLVRDGHSWTSHQLSGNFFVPGQPDGVQLEQDSHSGRPFYAPEAAPNR